LANFKEINTSYNIEKVLRQFGYEPTKHKKYLCPFHDEKTPSASINRNNNTLRCFGACNKDSRRKQL
jgi:DNA primase